jgi:hypothetical protein
MAAAKDLARDERHVVRDSHHHVASDDAAALPTVAEERETAEHLAFSAFSDVKPAVERSSNAIRELLVVRHADPGSRY